MVAVDRERALGGRTVREDGIEVAVQENVDMVGVGLISRDEAVTHFRAEIDELGREADGVKVALHDFGGARRIVRAAVEIDERSKILQIVVKECHFCFLFFLSREVNADWLCGLSFQIAKSRICEANLRAKRGFRTE